MMMKKRGHPTFNVPNYGTKSRSRVKARWRKQRGDDNKKRIKKAFMGAEPTIGYGNPEEVKGIRASGKRLMIVGNMDELRSALRMPDISGYDIAIAHAVSKRKRMMMTELATQSKMTLTNGVTMKKEEKKPEAKKEAAKPAAAPAPAQAVKK